MQPVQVSSPARDWYYEEPPSYSGYEQRTFSVRSSIQSERSYTNSEHRLKYPADAHIEYELLEYADGTEMSPEEHERQLAEEQAFAWIPHPPANTAPRQIFLQKPVVIPRINFKGRLGPPPPFVRAYSPDLHSHEVEEHDFLAFIDTLSVAEAGPVPLQVLNLAGTGLGFVPYHWAQIAGISMSVAAGVARAVFARIRTKRFLEVVNREYFAPRGLKVSICKNEDLVAKLDLGLDAPSIIRYDFDETDNSLRHRRLKALEPYIAPLCFDVPPPARQDNILDRISAKQLGYKMKRSEKKRRKKEEKLRNSKRDRKAKRMEKQYGKEVKKVGKLEYIVVENL
ncbi:hypothetical protein BX600DRAFT_518891 [Xylariales sp. PMI_506]|nr:hypothetical protein BX600DRAFT_518891 [Xylariales sp. PMI_506]